jgi:hypothetical protein
MKAALRLLRELATLGAAKSVDLYFGPTAPAGKDERWIKTIPRQGLVHVLPHLLTGGSGVRRIVEAGRLRDRPVNRA